MSTESRHYWDARYAAAREFMESRKGRKSALIEIAAQHPLAGGRRPGAEFTARLSRGAALFRSLREAGTAAEIYVPGSRHMYHGIPDEISLSEAGVTWLREHGVPGDILHGDDLNTAYKGDAGVYCSADECFVAASYFKDRDFGTLISVMSPAQMMRKTLHCIAFGVVPLCYAEPAETLFHSYIDEAFDKIPFVLHEDPSHQGDSAMGRRMREQRKPPEVC